MNAGNPMNENMPPQYLRELLETTYGKRAIRWAKPDCGLSSAYRFSVQLEDGRQFFVKAAADEQTEKWLRNEYLALSLIRKKFVPRVIDWLDAPGSRPVLVVEDLSAAYWPASHKGVTWRKGDFDLLFDGIKELSALAGDSRLPALKNSRDNIWAGIASDPKPFLTLQLCSERWLENGIDDLMQAEKRADVTGDRLVHGDIRSDNICFVDSQVLFVDWSHAARGNGFCNLANLLPTLYLEGGPLPHEVMPDGGSFASLGCATHIRRLAEDHAMPHWLKNVFKKLIAIELEWAAHCLGLDRPF